MTVYSHRVRAARLGAFACLFTGLAALTGCRPGIADISGTVSYKGQPLKFGSVQFESTGGIQVGTIGPDGSYTVKGVASGPVRILVSAVDPKFAEKAREYSAKSQAGMANLKSRGAAAGAAAAAAPPTPPDPAQYTAIPLHYSSFDTSKLSVDVKRGSMKHDLTLTD
jgi:hypothetical protein